MMASQIDKRHHTIGKLLDAAERNIMKKVAEEYTNIPGDDILLHVAKDSVNDILNQIGIDASEFISRALIQEELKASIIMELMCIKAGKTQGSDTED